MTKSKFEIIAAREGVGKSIMDDSRALFIAYSEGKLSEHQFDVALEFLANAWNDFNSVKESKNG